MALAFLVGSQGHFGQSKITPIASTVQANPPNSPLVMTRVNITLLMELLVNTLIHRGKDGPGGYSASTFDIKLVLFALRCLLTHTTNQIRVADLSGTKLNSLLLKILARFSIENVAWMNDEAAEHAIFCLYLQSNYGFDQPFLPESFSDATYDTKSLAAKVFTSYLLRSRAPTPAGKHAAQQLLLRLEYLSFDGRVSDSVRVANAIVSYEFGEDLLSQAKLIPLGKIVCGAKPREGIFDRPIMRSRKLQKGTKALAPWDNMKSVSIFANALQAAQQLSFGSTKVRHVGLIDDIMIANNIVRSACGEKTECYSFLWVCEDRPSKISRNLGRRANSPVSNGPLFRPVSTRTTEAPSFFPITCGPLCSADTTI